MDHLYVVHVAMQCSWSEPCVLAQDGGRVFHRMEHCWREDTVDIVSKNQDFAAVYRGRWRV